MLYIKSIYSSKFFLPMVIGALVCSLVGGFFNFLLLAVTVQLGCVLYKTVRTVATNQNKENFSW